MHMGHYLKKFAISGTISAVFFAGFLYFIYGAEGAKYEEEKAREPQKQYEESIIVQVNSEVAKTMENLSREWHAPVAQSALLAQEQGAYAPTDAIETTIYDDTMPQPQEIVKTPPEQYIAAAIPAAPQIPSATIPNITPITIPTIPSPRPTPTIQPILTTPVQQKPAAMQPRTTVS